MNKAITLFLFTVLISSTTLAQDVFSKYSENSKVTYISIKPKMFQLLAKMDIDTEDKEAQQYIEMVNSITSFKTIMTSDKAIASDFSKYVKVASRKLEELMKVKDDGVVMTFFVKEGKDEDHVSELLMYVDGLTDITSGVNLDLNGKKRTLESVVVLLTGDIDLNQISKLTSKMNLPGGDALDKKNKK
jgi:hypothetical protein